MEKQSYEERATSTSQPTVNGWMRDHAGEWEYRVVNGRIDGTKRKMGLIARMRAEIDSETTEVAVAD